MAFGDDFSINAAGDIRHTSGTTVYTVQALHEWLQDLADDAQATGDDLLSILTANPSKLDGPRDATSPAKLNLLGAVNIDDTAAQFLNFGSIRQGSGQVLYTGVRSIGSPLVSGTPIYIVQNNAKTTKFWPNGHIRVLVKGRTAGALIDNGDIRVYSRKYGQTYGDFAANLAAGGEQPAAISTSLTDWTTLSEAQAAALASNITITVGATNQSTGDANGTKEYRGTITLSGGVTALQAAQYLQYLCREDSTETINSIPGWRYRMLDDGYVPNGAAPFGEVAGGKWFVARGWWIAGLSAADQQRVQLTSHDGSTVVYPQSGQITITSLTVGSRVLVGRDNGSGGMIEDEYTLSAAVAAGGSTCVMTQAIKGDTPDTGYLRINGRPYSYTAVNRSTRTFTISGTFGTAHAANSPAWCPFIDRVATATTETSTSFLYAADFVARVKARKGSSPASKQPAEATFNVGAGVSSYGVIQPDDE